MKWAASSVAGIFWKVIGVWMRLKQSERSSAVDVSRSPTDTVVDDLGCDVIIPASPIVPSDDDGGVRPILAIANGIDNRGYPGGSAAVVALGVIGLGAVGDHPTHLRKLAVGDVHQDLRLRNDHIVGPIRAGAGERAVYG